MIGHLLKGESMIDSLMDTSLRTWERMLKERRSDFRVFLGADRIDRVFVKSCVREASGGDLMSVHLCSVFESNSLNYLDQELASFQLVPLLFGYFH
jgi:hypothetical protein